MTRVQQICVTSPAYAWSEGDTGIITLMAWCRLDKANLDICVSAKIQILVFIPKFNVFLSKG